MMAQNPELQFNNVVDHIRSDHAVPRRRQGANGGAVAPSFQERKRERQGQFRAWVTNYLSWARWNDKSWCLVGYSQSYVLEYNNIAELVLRIIGRDNAMEIYP